ncbi:transient receptor potential cation channel subfamily M member 5-like [Saccostrea cucullata]|uniref:transient receptor potential cation channel subfamily M member 5-like n=1 Tax=Saccostrea cuccullata TaxID=36930 RepID=UPI002ED5B3FF
MMVGNLLIVNLIIALFTTKFENVHEKSALIWQYERYHVIQDFRHRMFANLHFFILPCRLVMRAKSAKYSDKIRKELKRIRERQILQYIMAGRSLGK